MPSRHTTQPQSEPHREARLCDRRSARRFVFAFAFEAQRKGVASTSLDLSHAGASPAQSHQPHYCTLTLVHVVIINGCHVPFAEETLFSVLDMVGEGMLLAECVFNLQFTDSEPSQNDKYRA